MQITGNKRLPRIRLQKPKTRSQGPLQPVPWSEKVGRVGEDPGNEVVGKQN